MKGGFKLKDIKNAQELLIFVFDFFSKLLKKVSEIFEKINILLSESRKFNLLIFIVLIISILLFKLFICLFPSQVIVIIYILICLTFSYRITLKFICMILNLLSQFFKHASIFVRIISVFIFIFGILLMSMITSFFISTCLSYKIFSSLITKDYFIWWILLTLLISVIIMGFIAYGCSIYIVHNYKKNYEQIIISFSLEFLTGTLFTLVVGLKDVVSASLIKILTSNLGEKTIILIEKTSGIKIASLIITVLYWLFSLIFCFQLIYKTIKKVKQNNVSL